jgi:hypothetical protein
VFRGVFTERRSALLDWVLTVEEDVRQLKKVIEAVCDE